MDETEPFEAGDQADAFGMLSDPKRIKILQALWEITDEEASFSELRDRAGIEDSGQFNYHLDKLTDQFVAKHGDTYRLQLAGIQVVGSMLAGTYTKGDGVDPIPIDDPCPACGGSLLFEYRDEWVSIDCRECDITSKFGVPPGVFVGYNRDELPDVAQRYGRNTVRQLRNGFCPYCEGKIHPTVKTLDDAETGLPDQFSAVPFVQFVCDRCNMDMTVDIGASLQDHPSVVSFYYEQGVDPTELSFWEFGAVTRDQASIQSEEPFRATVTYDKDDTQVTLTVDRSLHVLDSDRVTDQ
ncbi:winged helix-turn-helix domain-containing protein [Halostella pelagica]|uniref:winged helix-turn-helix domain-containing protein n=1 Tax=Halostella pelagica TaxID=2583824 RepID=UPI001386D64D|nr:helix-turn-helix domain-containing protein [Halostella pelagica]